MRRRVCCSSLRLKLMMKPPCLPNAVPAGEDLAAIVFRVVPVADLADPALRGNRQAAAAALQGDRAGALLAAGVMAGQAGLGHPPKPLRPNKGPFYPPGLSKARN